MNASVLKGKWRQLSGSAKARWGALTDNELQEVSGDVDRFVGLLQEKLGVSQSEARRQIEDWVNEHELS